MFRDTLFAIKNSIKRRNNFMFELMRSSYIYFKYMQQSFFAIFKKVKVDICYLEFTSICNLNCKFCSLDDSRSKGFMKEEVLIKILEDIKNNNISIRELSLHLAGETLLHPKTVELLKIITKYKRQMKNFPQVTLLTNVVPLTKQFSKRILETDALDEMRFSIDGGNKQKFEEIRIGAKWDQVLKKANEFLDLNKSMNKNIKTKIFTILNNIQKEEKNFAPEFIKLKNRVIKCILREPHNWLGDVSLGLEAYPRDDLCHFILKDLSIFWDGRVTTCCADLNGKGVIGDLRKQTIKEVFFSKPRMKIIQMMRQGRRKRVPSCSNCSL